MKTIRLLLAAWSHWLLIDPRSEKFFNWALIITGTLFFGNLIIHFLNQNL
jgi:hypothetical protein